jgi:hypothetical protein
MNPSNNSNQPQKKNGTSSTPNNSNHISKYYQKSTSNSSTFAFLDKTMNTIVTNTFGFKQPIKKATTNGTGTGAGAGKHETSISETVEAKSIAKKVSKPAVDLKKIAAVVIQDEVKKTDTIITDKIENEFENKENFPHENGNGVGERDNGLIIEEVVKVSSNGHHLSGTKAGTDPCQHKKDEGGIGEDTIIL